MPNHILPMQVKLTPKEEFFYTIKDPSEAKCS